MRAILEKISVMHLHCRNVMLITLGMIFFFSLIIGALMFISQLQCGYANSNPMKH